MHRPACLLTVVPAFIAGSAYAGAPPAATVLRCWGGAVPAACEGLPEVTGALGVAQLELGNSFGLVRLSDGTVSAWGLNSLGQADVPVLDKGVTFSQIAAGSAHCVALLSDGSLRVWGANNEGQQTLPTIANGTTVLGVGAGQNHCLAILSDGSIIGWGANAAGQASTQTPVSSATTVRGGFDHSAALLSDGTILAWGDNTEGELNVPVIAPATFDSVACGRNFTVALDSDGTVRVWGDSSVTTVPVAPAGEAIVEAGGGYLNAYHRTDAGTVTVWGANDSEQNTVPRFEGRFPSLVGVGNEFLVAVTLVDCDENGQLDGDEIFNDPNLDCDGDGGLDSCQIADDATLDCNDNDILDSCEVTEETDCDGNDKFDSCEIDADPDLDCDENGELDSCEIAADESLDCDEDGELDSCQPTQTGLTSTLVSPFGAGDEVEVAGTSLALPVSDVRIEAIVKADIGSFGEWVALSLNDTIIDYMFVTGGDNCPDTANVEAILIDKDLFIGLAPDGDATFKLTPTSFVSDVECPNSSARLRITWRAASADCNNNGSPDLCELLAGDITDRDDNGVPDTCEYFPRYDIDGNGKADLMWWNSSARIQTAWLLNGTTLAESEDIGDVPGSQWQLRAFADLDGDDRADLVYYNATQRKLRANLLNGTDVVQSAAITNEVLAEGVSLVGTPDLDGDGNQDLLFRNSSSGEVTGWLMAGVARREQAVIGPAVGLTYLGTGDFDGDGDGDILWRNSGGRLRIWLVDGLTLVEDELIPDVPTRPSSTWRAPAVGDLDNDGKADIVWQRIDTGAVSGWLMDGISRLSSGVIDANATASVVVEAAVDANGDSKSDLIVRNSTNGEVRVWIMDGLTRDSNASLGTRNSKWSLISR
jgi:alpha-tubulin suppressor-like RCC1 family protein